MEKRLDEGIVPEEVKPEGVESNEMKGSAVELEKEMEKSDEMGGKKEEKRESGLILSNPVKAYYFPNELTFALFSVSSFIQIRQREVELFLVRSIPKSIIGFASLQELNPVGIHSWNNVNSNQSTPKGS